MNDHETIQGTEEQTEQDIEWGYRIFCPYCGTEVLEKNITQEWNGSTEMPEIRAMYYCEKCDDGTWIIPDDMPGEAYPITRGTLE